jgi:hypothetical protein
LPLGFLLPAGLAFVMSDLILFKRPFGNVHRQRFQLVSDRSGKEISHFIEPVEIFHQFTFLLF